MHKSNWIISPSRDEQTHILAPATTQLRISPSQLQSLFVRFGYPCLNQKNSLSHRNKAKQNPFFLPFVTFRGPKSWLDNSWLVNLTPSNIYTPQNLPYEKRLVFSLKKIKAGVSYFPLISVPRSYLRVLAGRVDLPAINDFNFNFHLSNCIASASQWCSHRIYGGLVYLPT